MIVLIGTSGYDYADWVGEDRLYPASLAGMRQDWLTYYASQFPVVELNFTYYGRAKPSQLESMLRRKESSKRLFLMEGEFSPRPGFQFIIKAYRELTHEVSGDWRGDCQQFQEDIAPLTDSGRLAAVLAQFPSRLKPTARSLAYISELVQQLGPVPVVVELRRAQWFDAGQLDDLRQTGAVICGVDAPRESFLPSVVEDGRLADTLLAPAPGFSYIRLHGRREGYWWKGDAASRYDYAYAADELRRLAERIASSRVENVYVLFNNHRQANAARDARILSQLIEDILSSIDKGSS